MAFNSYNHLNIAGDISKKITIEVELETEKLTQNITNLNKSIDKLLAKQKELNTAGQQNSIAFESVFSKLETFQKRLQEVNTQVAANTTSLNALAASGKVTESSLSSLTAQHQKMQKLQMTVRIKQRN